MIYPKLRTYIAVQSLQNTCNYLIIKKNIVFSLYALEFKNELFEAYTTDTRTTRKTEVVTKYMEIK